MTWRTPATPSRPYAKSIARQVAELPRLWNLGRALFRPTSSSQMGVTGFQENLLSLRALRENLTARAF
jgi:hypothetical protein